LLLEDEEHERILFAIVDDDDDGVVVVVIVVLDIDDISRCAKVDKMEKLFSTFCISSSSPGFVASLFSLRATRTQYIVKTNLGCVSRGV